MIKWVYTLPLLALAWGAHVKAAPADIDAGKAKAVVCAACHGPQGKATIPTYPHLAGQNAGYLVKQLKAFKDGSRKDPVMMPFVAALSEADMENLAAFYASLK